MWVYRLGNGSGGISAYDALLGSYDAPGTAVYGIYITRSTGVINFFNSAGFWWTVSVLFYDETATNYYFAYIITLVIFNLIEFFSTLIIATKVRKGQHTEFFFFGDVTNLICKTNEGIK
jgi:hypothetical protein